MTVHIHTDDIEYRKSEAWGIDDRGGVDDDDVLLVAHLPNDIMFETTGDGEVLASCRACGLGRQVLHLTPDQAADLGRALLRMATLAECEEEQARFRAWGTEASEPGVLIHTV